MNTSAPLILLVEDEPHIADVAEFLFREQGWRCLRAEDGTLGWRLFQEEQPDLVLLDLGLPGLHGHEVLRRIREAAPERAVILLTARGEVDDRVRGMEAGADDYICKPFDNRELVARVRAVLRRAPASPARPLLHGKLQLRPEAFELHVGTHVLPLPRHECLLLQTLMRQPARIFTRDQLLTRMYGDEAELSDRAVDAAVTRLRKKVHQVAPELNPVESVYGLGYRLAREPA